MVGVVYDGVLAGAQRSDAGLEVIELDVVVRRVASGGFQPQADRMQRSHAHKSQEFEADEGWPLRELIDGRLMGNENSARAAAGRMCRCFTR